MSLSNKPRDITFQIIMTFTFTLVSDCLTDKCIDYFRRMSILNTKE